MRCSVSMVVSVRLGLSWRRIGSTSQPKNRKRSPSAGSGMSVLPLIRQRLAEHEALINEAGVLELLRKSGWIKLFRSEETLAKALTDFERARAAGKTTKTPRRRQSAKDDGVIEFFS